MLVVKARPESSRLYMGGARSSVLTAAAACLEIRAGSKQISLLEIDVISGSSAGNQTFGLGRPAAIGVTPTTSFTLLTTDPGDPASLTSLATAWTTGPTVPANFLRRAEVQATAGGGSVWTFGPREMIIPASGSLVVWNISTTLASDFTVIIEE